MKIIPIKFKNLNCPKCGEENSIRFISRSNRACDKIDNAEQGAYFASCIFCGQKYRFQWDKDEYLITDPNLSNGDFIEQFSDHQQRDIMLIAAKEYELP